MYFCQQWPRACMLVKIFIIIWNMACLLHHRYHSWNAPPTTALYSHPLFAVHKCSSGIQECQLVLFFLHGGTEFHTFVLYATPCQRQFCLSIICHMAAKCNGTLLGRFNFYCHTTSDVMGQHNKIRNITFRAVLIYSGNTCIHRCLHIQSSSLWNMYLMNNMRPHLSHIWVHRHGSIHRHCFQWIWSYGKRGPDSDE